MALTDRFTEYVAELHELSDIHRLSHGKPEDLSRFLEAAQKSQSFAEEFGCVMRSIAIREHFRPSETELLTLVAVAWAGTEPDESDPQSSHLIHELGIILHKALAQRVLSHRAGTPSKISTEEPVEAPDVSSRLPDETRELEIHPQLHVDGQAAISDRHENQNGAPKEPVSAQHGYSLSLGKHEVPGGAPQEPEPIRPVPSFRFLEASGKGLTWEEDKSKSSENPLSYVRDTASEKVPARRLEPSLAEVVAMGLTGLVVALLFNAEALPIYRARVSVSLPSTIAGALDPGANSSDSPPSALTAGPRDASLLNGDITEKVAQRLLASPQAKSILRQDVLSRGMRDLNLGGNETILYADLVAETAHQVKVTHLQPQNLYAITCDSWNAQFAATFCNEMTAALVEQPSDAISSQGNSEPARTIDAALQPGVQIYPRWYLQGAIGLAVGCVTGFLVGFVKRPSPKPVPEDGIEA